MYINPVIPGERAKELLSGGNRIWPPRKVLAGIELVRLPLYIFSIALRNRKGECHTETVSVDGIRGEFAFFREGPVGSGPDEIQQLPVFSLGREAASELALAECRRMLLKRNLRNANTTDITGISEGTRLAWPFWVGYFKRKGKYDFTVIDAVDGSVQGMKMKPVFIDLLLMLDKERIDGAPAARKKGR